MSEVKFKKSSGNVYPDRQLPNPEQHFLKATLAIKLLDLISKKELTQSAAATRLGIKQPEISRIKKDNLSHYSVERLLEFFNRLDQRVEISIKPAKGKKSAETVLS